MSPWRAVALTVFVASGLATPLGGRAMERACAAGQLHVAIVVDPGSGGTVSAVCVPGSSGDNGATILAARASMLGVPQPSYSSSGLLCSIDGVPKTGCGTASGGTYAYWSYWHGSGGTWSYSNSGPASGRVDSGIVEGWRFQPHGSALPTDPPPRGPARAAAVCVPAPPPTAPPPATAPRATTTPSPTFATGPSPTLGAQGASNTAPSTRPRTSTPNSATTRPATPNSAAVTTVTTARTRTTTSAGRSASASIAITARGIAASPSTHTAHGAPVGLVTGVSLVIALGAGGAIAARRRRPAS